MRRLRTTLLTGLLGLAVSASALVAAAPAQAAVICEQYGSTAIQNGRYIVGNNRWGTSATQCIDVTSTGFTITQADGTAATNGAPKSYPTVYYGCHYGNCSTNGNILSPNGLQASDPAFAGISTSVSMTYPSSGTYDAAYDIWFNKSRPTTTTGQNDGAELMIWLRREGSIQPIGSRIGTATIAGSTWEVWSGNTGWNVISYVRTSPTNSLSFSVKSFWDDVVSRGLGSNSWYLTSIQAGFEPWIGGAGLAVNNFSVTTGSTPPPTSPPPTTPPPTTPQPSGSGACAATYSTVNSWQGGSQGSVTVRNSGSSSISGWTVKWTYPNGQTISSLWNGRLTQSGSSETVRNESYNGSLAPNASTTFGFQVSGASPGTPTLTCTPG